MKTSIIIAITLFYATYNQSSKKEDTASEVKCINVEKFNNIVERLKTHKRGKSIKLNDTTEAHLGWRVEESESIDFLFNVYMIYTVHLNKNTNELIFNESNLETTYGPKAFSKTTLSTEKIKILDKLFCKLSKKHF
jgi:hypothetical protein